MPVYWRHIPQCCHKKNIDGGNDVILRSGVHVSGHVVIVNSKQKYWN